MRTESLSTTPPRLRMPISVVPPPISTTIFPEGTMMSSPAPSAAASGSSMRYVLDTPAWIVASSTARFSTDVMCTGMQVMTLGLKKKLFPATLFTMYSSIFWVIV